MISRSSCLPKGPSVQGNMSIQVGADNEQPTNNFDEHATRVGMLRIKVGQAQRADNPAIENYRRNNQFDYRRGGVPG